MDIWEKLYLKAKEQYHPEDVTPFVYAHHVVCALESENGEIFTGFCIESCSGVMNLCAPQVWEECIVGNSGQTVVKRMIAFRDALTAKGIHTTIRTSRGEDIQAACGLLSTAQNEAAQF